MVNLPGAKGKSLTRHRRVSLWSQSRPRIETLDRRVAAWQNRTYVRYRLRNQADIEGSGSRSQQSGL